VRICHLTDVSVWETTRGVWWKKGLGSSFNLRSEDEIENQSLQGPGRSGGQRHQRSYSASLLDWGQEKHCSQWPKGDEDGIDELYRKEGIAQRLYFSWRKEFLEAGKKRLDGGTARGATSDKVLCMCFHTQALMEVMADLTMEFWMAYKICLFSSYRPHVSNHQVWAFKKQCDWARCYLCRWLHC